MISSLRGKLIYKDAATTVVECGGVGYGLAMSLTSLTRLGLVGSEVFVLVSTQFSQDALKLYGFIESAERDVFQVLIGTSGVGPKLALSILSVLSPQELVGVVDRGDKARLVQIPGVGAKKAARLLLELKDRLSRMLGTTPIAGVVSPRAIGDDLTSALVNLGFKEAVAEDASRAALDTLPEETDVAILVREALRSTQPRR